MRKYTIIVEEVAEGYVATVAELPGANTQGGTLREVLANIAEAIELVEAANAEMAGN